MKLVDSSTSPLQDLCTTAWDRSIHYSLVIWILATLSGFYWYCSNTTFVQAFRDGLPGRKIPYRLMVQTNRIPRPTICHETRAGIMVFLKRWCRTLASHVSRVRATIAVVVEAKLEQSNRETRMLIIYRRIPSETPERLLERNGQRVSSPQENGAAWCGKIGRSYCDLKSQKLRSWIPAITEHRVRLSQD